MVPPAAAARRRGEHPGVSGRRREGKRDCPTVTPAQTRVRDDPDGVPQRVPDHAGPDRFVRHSLDLLRAVPSHVAVHRGGTEKGKRRGARLCAPPSPLSLTLSPLSTPAGIFTDKDFVS